MTHTIVGKKAPSFTLPDQDGKDHALSDYAGKLVLLYFYPKDMTPGCTIEACSFRDHLNDLKKQHIAVLGVSADSVTRHKKFSEKERLNFPLLSDQDKETIKAYGALGKKSMFGNTYLGILRDSFLIGKDGIVLKHYRQVNPNTHAAEVLSDVRALSV